MKTRSVDSRGGSQQNSIRDVQFRREIEFLSQKHREREVVVVGPEGKRKSSPLRVVVVRLWCVWFAL
jgi:hypothetical protein